MSKATGIALILVGLAVGYEALSLSPDGERSEPPLKRITAQIEDAAAAPAPPVLAGGTQPSSALQQPSVRPKLSLARPDESPSSPPPLILTPAKHKTAAPSVRSAAALPDRAQLAHVLQRELRRVGCYAGELNGAWTLATQRAMQAFLDRVNATLPVDRPDYILLTLVQEEADEVCRKPCPTGQGLSAEGRCLPNAILARRSTQVVTAALAHKPQPPAPPSPATIGSLAISAAPRAPALEGRMALAGPKAEAPTRRARPAMAALPAAYRPFRRPPVVNARRSPPSRVAWRSRPGGWVRWLFFRSNAY